MMQGWKIFTHSLRMVLGNLGPALRISLVLYLIQAAVGYVFMHRFGAALQDMKAGRMDMMPPGFGGMWLLFMAVSMITSLWIAVSWHRYVLLEETPGTVLPPFHGRQILMYFWVSILLGLILGLAGLVLGFVAAMIITIVVGSATVGVGGSILAMIIMVCIVFGPLVFLFYRLSPVLPAAAIGEPMTFAEAREATAPASGAILQFAVIAVLAAILFELPSTLNPDKLSLINIIYSNVLGWAYLMVGISALTTIYGHYVQGRAL